MLAGCKKASTSTFEDLVEYRFARLRNTVLFLALIRLVLPLDVVVRAEDRLENLPGEQRRNRPLQPRPVHVGENVARAGLVVAHAYGRRVVGDELLSVRVTGVAVVIVTALGLLQYRLGDPVPVYERHTLAVYRVSGQGELALGVRS